MFAASQYILEGMELPYPYCCILVLNCDENLQQIASYDCRGTGTAMPRSAYWATLIQIKLKSLNINSLSVRCATRQHTLQILIFIGWI